ncbi:MAG: hypothetical protein WBK55_00865 [Alphaproteobacteria bacterium]
MITWSTLYEGYAAERRALGTPVENDGFPSVVMQSDSCKIFFNLVTASSGMVDEALVDFIGQDESPLKIIYLPAINPATGLGDPCGSSDYNLGKDKQSYESQIRSLYERRHPEINRLTEHFLRTGGITHELDNYKCVLTIPRFQNGHNETDDKWKKRTEEASLYIIKLFGDVARVVSGPFENGRIVLMSKKPGTLKDEVEKIFGITPSDPLALHQDHPSPHQHLNLAAT